MGLVFSHAHTDSHQKRKRKGKKNQEKEEPKQSKHGAHIKCIWWRSRHRGGRPEIYGGNEGGGKKEEEEEERYQANTAAP
ncbi:unnamed protein product [Musa acuminata subsp. burmannicoides]